MLKSNAKQSVIALHSNVYETSVNIIAKKMVVISDNIVSDHTVP